MSTVERALKKLREARANDKQSAPVAQTPIAKLAVDQPDLARRDASQGSPGPDYSYGKTIEFDLEGLRAAGLYAAANQGLADQFRVIKRPLLTKAAETAGRPNEGANLIMVVSALAGEGKTFTCVNLALSIATEKDWRVLLVDADCKNPQLSRLLGVDEEQGLLDVLREDARSLDSAVIATSIPGLAVLPLGHRDDHAAELLASERMAGVCAQLSTAYPNQIVIFDTSPILLTTESAELSRHVGQAVLVVRANRTPQGAVIGALHKLDPSKAIGLVLNCAHESGEAYNYGSYGTYPHTAT